MEEPLGNVPEKLYEKITEKKRIELDTHQNLCSVLDENLPPHFLHQHQRHDNEQQAVPRIAQDHAEEDGEEDADERRRIVGSIGRQWKEAREKLEGLEIGRVLQDDRHPLEILFTHLFLHEHDVRTERFSNPFPELINVGSRHPSVDKKAHPRLEGRGGRPQQGPAAGRAISPHIVARDPRARWTGHLHSGTRELH